MPAAVFEPFEKLDYLLPGFRRRECHGLKQARFTSLGLGWQRRQRFLEGLYILSINADIAVLALQHGK